MNVCVGFFTVDFGVPSPKFQLHVVGVPELVSVNVTVNGTLPDTLLAVNADVGGWEQ